jgi:hypothetical protein
MISVVAGRCERETRGLMKFTQTRDGDKSRARLAERFLPVCSRFFGLCSEEFFY